MSGSTLRALLGLEVPLLCAGMGGVSGPELAAAVSAAGAGGTVGLYRLGPAAVAQRVRAALALTGRPLGVSVIPEQLTPAQLLDQVDAALDAGGPALRVDVFGPPPPALARRLAAHGARWLAQVGSAEDARHARDLGADAIALQGIQAGGHHLGSTELLALRDALGPFDRPLLAAGGITRGAELFALGAEGFDGCICGTLFLCAAEANAHPVYQQAILDAGPSDTLISHAFAQGWPGRAHRVLATPAARSTAPPTGAPIGALATPEGTFPVWPGSATVPTRGASGDIRAMALYCGTGCGALHRIRPAAEIVADFVASWEEARLAAPRSPSPPPGGAFA